MSRNLCVICSRVAAAAAHVRGSAGGDFLPFASLAFEIKFRHAAGARMIYTDEGVENLHEVCKIDKKIRRSLPKIEKNHVLDVTTHQCFPGGSAEARANWTSVRLSCWLMDLTIL